MASGRKRYNSSGVKYYKHKKKKNVNKQENENQKKDNIVNNEEINENLEKAIDELLEDEIISTKEEIKKTQDNSGKQIPYIERPPYIEEENNIINIEPSVDKSIIKEEKNEISSVENTSNTVEEQTEFEDKLITNEVTKELIDDNNSIEKENNDKTINVNEEFENQLTSQIVDEVQFENENLQNVSDNKFSDFHSKTKNKIYLSYNMRLLLNIVGVLSFAILAIILFIFSISIKARSNVLYKQTSNLDYKVYLKENDYFNESYLSGDMQYIASLINDIGVDFNYNFSANQNINYKYTYYVNADVLVTDTQDESKIIYSKSNKITEPNTVVNNNSNGFSINENVKVNYQEYNDIVKSFKSSYGISANSKLVLSLLIEIEDEKGNKIRTLNSSDTMKITIPLTEQMINIEMDYKEVNNSNNAKIYKDFSISNKITFIISILSFIISLAFLIRLLIFVKKTTAKKTIYDITLAKILREYDRVIVNSKKIVDLDNNNVIDVNNFSELLDVRDNLEKPIIFSELHKGQKSIFIVKTPNETYRYILKLSDLENK